MHAIDVTIHAAETRDQKAKRTGKHRSCFDVRDTPLCLSGNFHAMTHKYNGRVTCPACLEKLKTQKPIL